jgi:hypothetical protein
MTLDELNTYDWREAISYAPFDFNEISEVLYADEGENDGESWVGVFKLNDGRFGYVDAWCDYTGWDCQANGDGAIRDSFEDLQRWGLTTKIRRRLGIELPDLDGE